MCININVMIMCCCCWWCCYASPIYAFPDETLHTHIHTHTPHCHAFTYTHARTFTQWLNVSHLLAHTHTCTTDTYTHHGTFWPHHSHLRCYLTLRLAVTRCTFAAVGVIYITRLPFPVTDYGYYRSHCYCNTQYRSHFDYRFVTADRRALLMDVGLTVVHALCRMTPATTTTTRYSLLFPDYSLNACLVTTDLCLPSLYTFNDSLLYPLPIPPATDDCCLQRSTRGSFACRTNVTTFGLICHCAHVWRFFFFFFFLIHAFCRYSGLGGLRKKREEKRREERREGSTWKHSLEAHTGTQRARTLLRTTLTWYYLRGGYPAPRAHHRYTAPRQGCAVV